MKSRLLCIWIISGALGGCASVQPIMAPSGASLPIKAHISPRLPTLQEKFGAATDIPNSYFGVSGARGSLAVGLLGPLGVLANIAHVQSSNEKSALGFSTFSSINLAKMLSEADGSLQVSGVHQTGEYSLVPAGRIFALDEKKFLVACVLNVEYNQGVDKPWKTYYEVNPDVIFEIGDAENKTAVASTLREFLLTAKELFLAHISGTIGSPTTKDIKLSDINLRMPVYTAKLPARVVANNGFGVQEFRRSIVLKVE